MSDRFFPIKTDTSCPSKWQWSTLYLNTGVSRSCHRTAEVKLTPENFFSFHNNDLVLSDRQRMIDGQWPIDSCRYCKKIEESGGVSDRLTQRTIPNLVPVEMENDPMAIKVSPTIVEIYFNNTCNLACLYCSPSLSSRIAVENKKHGSFSKNGVELISPDNHFRDLMPYFWQWFDQDFSKVKRLHILGGEPFYQKEFDRLLEKIYDNPNPNCELNVVSNLMISKDKLNYYIEHFKNLLVNRKLKRVDITCSIDCWGPQQEYVRQGLDLSQWEENFNILLKQKWLTININQTISTLTIKTMPDLLKKLQHWRTLHKIGHWFSGVWPAPSYMMAEIFGKDEFESSFDEIISLMPTETQEEKQSQKYMIGILDHCRKSIVNITEINKLITYLDEKDRRWGTDWEKLFPWLVEYKNHVV